jgi:hypothetical protein
MKIRVVNCGGSLSLLAPQMVGKIEVRISGKNDSMRRLPESLNSSDVGERK